MKTRNLLSGLVLIAGITVISCTKNHNPATATSSVNFKIQATSKVQPVARNLSASLTADLISSFEWDTAQMVVSKIELNAEKEHEKESGTLVNSISARDGGGDSESGKDGSSDSGNDHEGNNNDSTGVNFEWTGPVKVDLFNLNSVLGGVNLVPGMFHNVTLEIKSFKSDAGSSPNFYLAGNYTNAAGTVKRINVVVNEDFKLQIAITDTLNFANDFTSIIKVNLVQLLNGITQTELDNAVLTNDKLVISRTVNVTLFDAILKNLHESGETEFEKD